MALFCSLTQSKDPEKWTKKKTRAANGRFTAHRTNLYFTVWWLRWQCFCLFRNSIFISPPKIYDQREKKSVALCLHNVCNSNPWSGHTTQTMNWNAMFHFLYSTPAQCLTATSIFAEAQMQRFFQICWRKRRVSTHKNCRVKNGNNIRFESSHDTDIDCNILRMRGILGLFQSLARFELIHLSAVVTKFFAKNGSMRNERVEKMLRAKDGIAYDSNTVPPFFGPIQ